MGPGWLYGLSRSPLRFASGQPRNAGFQSTQSTPSSPTIRTTHLLSLLPRNHQPLGHRLDNMARLFIEPASFRIRSHSFRMAFHRRPGRISIHTPMPDIVTIAASPLPWAPRRTAGNNPATRPAAVTPNCGLMSYLAMPGPRNFAPNVLAKHSRPPAQCRPVANSGSGNLSASHGK